MYRGFFNGEKADSFPAGRKYADYPCFCKSTCRIYLSLAAVEFYDKFYFNSAVSASDNQADEYRHGRPA